MVNLKRLLTAIVTALLFISGFTSCDKDDITPPEADTMQDGIFEGTGEGRGGTILVRITVAGHTITDARIISQSESSFAQESMQQMLNTVLLKQGLLDINVDGITGATLTCTGVIDALNAAIRASMGMDADNAPDYKDCSCDIVVVGGGGAGLCAAIQASDMGARVIVLEKQGILGGNTNFSTGGINAAESSIQKALGIQDTKALFFDDTMKGGHYVNDTDLVKSFVDHAPATIDWLIALGADLSDIGIMGGSSVKRTHRPQSGKAIGPHLMQVLKRAAADNDIDIRTRNEVTGLIYEHGAIKGVEVTNATGGKYSIRSAAVIIATGGFGANLAMVTKYCPELSGFGTLNHKGATGDAFGWVSSMGVGVRDMDKIQIHPTAEYTNNILITEAVRGNGAILVNASGHRFVNEMDTRDVVSKAILDQAGGYAFLIFDDQVRKSLSSIETYASQNLLTEAASIETLEQRLDMEAPVMQSTIERYNGFQQAGIDRDYGRLTAQMPVGINTPPYYAVKVKPAIHHTMGGLCVDPQMHVLYQDGGIIPGLFAAGEVTGGLHGANRLGGNGVADVVVNGKIAGESAARYVK